MAESLYGSQLKQLGFRKEGESPLSPEELANRNIPESLDNPGYTTLWDSRRPFFHFYADRTVAFDENRDMWIARECIDLRRIGFEMYPESDADRLVAKLEHRLQ